MEKSLVADYGSGEEELDSDSDSNENQILSGYNVSQRFGLLSSLPPDEESSSEQDNDGDKDNDGLDRKLIQSLKCKPALDNPFRNFRDNKICKKDSVFQIAFREQEKTESAALERHVKMTPIVGTQATINGKKICWNYRKGKCRFGHNCTFAHDSDIHVPVSDAPKKMLAPVLVAATATKISSTLSSLTKEVFEQTTYISSGAQLGGRKAKAKTADSSDEELEDTLTDNARGGKGKFSKKRSGLSQNLVPGKKVMKNYFEQKHQ